MCIEHQVFTCADCTVHYDFSECKKNNALFVVISSIFSGIDRAESLNRIKKIGLDKFKEEKLLSGTK